MKNTSKHLLRSILIVTLLLTLSIAANKPMKVSAATDKQVIATATAQKKTGWIANGKSKYYFKKGVMYTGWLSYNKKWYYLKPGTGKLITSQRFSVNGKYFYADKNGVRTSNWVTYKKKTYFFGIRTGVMQVSQWLHLNKKAYYVNAKGEQAKGITTIGKNKYYFNSKGVNQRGWIKLNGKSYYFQKKDGVLQKNKWITLSDKKYYMQADGSAALNTIATINKKQYFFDAKGTNLRGWVLYKNKYYYFQKKDGVLQKGKWLTLGTKKYYVDKSGVRKTGKITISSKSYYFDKQGVNQRGWIKISSKYYYFQKKDGVLQKGKWLTLGTKKYYVNKDGVRQTGIITISGKKYLLDSNGVLQKNAWATVCNDQYYANSNGTIATETYIDGKYVNVDGIYLPGYCQGAKTLKGFLQNASKAIGNTLYVWGGGHEYSKGVIGVQSGWKSWYKANGASYNYDKYRYKTNAGLDCSGFTGWSIFNNIYQKAGASTTTTTSSYFPSYLSINGWGSMTSITTKAKAIFTPGDVVCKSGHVWIIVGQCADKSVVLMHATPPYTQISGTCTPGGSYSSQAIKLATKYMNGSYNSVRKKFNGKYSNGTVSYLYGSDVRRFTWDLSGRVMFSDPQGYKNMTADQVLKDMYGY